MAYNTSPNESRNDCVVVDDKSHGEGDKFQFLYGGNGTLDVLNRPETGLRFVQLELTPNQFVILIRVRRGADR